MDFVVLDFETAQFGTNPCEIGLTFVANSRIIGTQGWLIKPSCYPHFDPGCVNVHGIEPNDVKHSPKFPAVWREIRPLLEGKLVLAHNAATYDMPVLRRTLDEYGLQYPNLKYGCTCYCARKAFPNFQNHKLEYLCRVLGISVHEHHRAEADSQAAAELALIMFRDHNINSIEDIQRRFRVNLWQIYPNGHYQKLPMPITIRTKKSPKSKFDDRDLDEQKHITELANRKVSVHGQFSLIGLNRLGGGRP